ncbi:sensor domain-containing protein [Mycolicibacter terrae]|nr:sensor domain-containing protein [Mycolicibacter terrae]SNV89111.1 conserved lipoprotein LppH [Mycolicibacter terrae]
MPPVAGGHFPPPWPPGPPPQRNRRLVRVLLGLACVLAVVAVVLAVNVVGRDRHESAQSATESDSGDGKLVPVSALEGLLPAKEVISSAVGDPGMGLVATGAGIDADVMVDAECQGLTSVSGPVLAGSGWTAVRWQGWNSPAEPDPPDWKHQALMSVTTYPHASTARAFYSKESAAWQKCSGRIINSRIPAVADSPGRFWSVESVTDGDGVLKATTISEGGGGWSCQNTLTVRSNVAVRVSVCAETDSTAAAQALLDSITAKIDAAA